jgi:D-alanyl-D-alanine carboxypeptidase/D-alanyl-D-alanine-endopeptidase (penicillin-binding protein 4)
MSIIRRGALALIPLLLLSCAVMARDGSYLPHEVERAIAQRRIPAGGVSIYVRDVDGAEPLVSYNATVPRNPASTMKVLTTYAALELLGPAYTWSTRAYATGPVRNGVLEGDLVLVGGGDPYMVTERWWAFVNGIRQAGISRIHGNVVIDDSLFAPQGDDRSTFDSRPYRSYNVIPDALLVGFQTVTISAIPDASTGRISASLQPWPANLTLDNSLKYQPGRCRSGGVVVAMPEGPTGNRISLAGRRAEACGPLTLTRAVMRAPEFAFGTFATFWKQSGGELSGGMRLGTVPPEARLLYEAESLSLAEIIRLVNKHSNNVMARMLLLTIAAEKSGRPATAAGGRQAVLDWLAAKGISIPELVIENGAGLSRNERISASGLADLLLAAHRSQYMPEFVASLPLSATDGTLKRRFRKPEMQGRLRMKTGTLEEVSAVAGYVAAASGRTYVAVMIVNAPKADEGAGDALQTALVEWLFGQ